MAIKRIFYSSADGLAENRRHGFNAIIDRRTLDDATALYARKTVQTGRRNIHAFKHGAVT